MKLIKLQDKFILVSDEFIEECDFGFNLNTKEIRQYDGVKGMDSYWKKIIADIPELPSIDFSLLSEADCKTIGWVDVEKLAEHDWIYNEYVFEEGYNPQRCIDGAIQKPKFINGFIKGFKKAQSFNDKVFSLKDMNAAIAFGFGICRKQDRAPFNKEIISFIQSLQQTSWEVEVEMQPTEQFDEATSIGVYVPKITKNSVKITKII